MILEREREKEKLAESDLESDHINLRFTSCSPFRFVFGSKNIMNGKGEKGKRKRKKKVLVYADPLSNLTPNSSQMPLTTKVLSLFNLSAFLS